VLNRSAIYLKFLFWGFIISGFYSPSLCQDSFNGRITDIETGKGIINATVVYGDGKGVLSDSSGSFVIKEPSFPMKLEISHLNYISQSVIVRSVFESGINIQLRSKRMDIDQVEIIGERLTRFFERRYFYTVDYAFLNDKIVLIGYDKSRLNHGQLVLTNLNQDTLSAKAVKKPKSLYKDAFGNVHLFAGDSVYQIAIANNKLELIYPTHRFDFYDVLRLQIAEDNLFVFKDIYGNDQLHLYYRIDTISRSIDTLMQVFDHNLFPDEIMAQRYKERRLRKLTLDYKGQMDTSLAAVRAANQLFLSTHYDNLIIHKPVTSQIFKCEGKYVILDIANSEIHTFSTDSLAERSLPLAIPSHSQRDKYFVQDEMTKKIYWVNYEGTKATLLELDTNTGQIRGSLQTPRYPFIEDIRVRNGIIWFLYQPLLGETVRSLYRMN